MRCPDLKPPIEPTTEYEPIMFDYGPNLAAGETITSVLNATIAVFSGTDPTPGSRLIGSPVIVSSPTTGAPNAAVVQGFGNGVDGCVYDMEVVAVTSNSVRRQLALGGRVPVSSWS